MDAAKSRTWLLLLAVLLIPILPWLLVGVRLEALADGAMHAAGVDGPNRWWIAAIGLGLLASDSFLPVPSTLVMSGLGFELGALVGGIVASIGLFLSGLIAYGACRRFGTRLARRIAGEKGMARLEQTMRQFGPALVAASRAVPVMQEATACLAGLARMPFRSFVPALAIGCVPSGFAYAAIGSSALGSPVLALGLSVAVPAITWGLMRFAVKPRPVSHEPQTGDDLPRTSDGSEI
jgi:uncharacterized membrane protein YdjX (TVP38/TMEM64 family)